MVGNFFPSLGEMLALLVVLNLAVASCGGCVTWCAGRYGDSIRTTAAEWIAPQESK